MREPTDPRAAALPVHVDADDLIPTPGHTLGHISVYDPAGSLLVAGDAMVNGESGVEGSPPQYTADMSMANASVRKLAALSYESLVFGHGDPIDSGASDAVAALAATLE